MRKASPDLLLDLPPTERLGDQLVLLLFDSALSYRLRRSGCGPIRVRVEGGGIRIGTPRGETSRTIETAVR